MSLAATLTIEPLGDRQVRISRRFAAPRGLVFDAHTRPELVRRWVGPATWTFTDCTIDLRVGGTYRYVMRGPEGDELVLHGTFDVVDPPSLLVTRESVSDDWTGGETRNTTTFDEVDGVTTVTLIIEFASAASRDAALATRMSEGVAEGFVRLDALLATGTPGAAYRRRADRFESLVTAVDPARWDDPSPCEGWRARDVVAHIVEMHDVMLRPAGRSLSPAPSAATDPVAAFRAARADVEALLGDHTAVAAETDAPLGRMTVGRHIDAVMSNDLVLHGWDLARATGLDDTIDPDEVAELWPGLEHVPDEMRIPDHYGPGVVVFGPEVPVPEDAPLQDRLLGKIGRDPRWRPPVTAD